MTPFGLHLQEIRRKRNITQQQMAAAIGVSPAYLSALEHGHRGKPSWAMLQRIVGYLNVIWDEAEKLQELAALSNPKVTIDTIKLSAQATETANLIDRHIHDLNDLELKGLADEIMRIIADKKQRNL